MSKHGVHAEELVCACSPVPPSNHQNKKVPELNDVSEMPVDVGLFCGYLVLVLVVGRIFVYIPTWTPT